jgi:multisubunit Na+/H+ antiporter MnhE subunit
MLLFVAIWAVSALAYVGLVGQLSVAEAGLGLACGLAAAVWSTALSVAGGLHFRFEATAAGAATRALTRLPRAVAQVVAAFVRGEGGRVVRQRFIHGRDQTPADAGRRAIILLTISLTPDKFALRFRSNRDQVELQSLVPISAETDPRWPT